MELGYVPADHAINPRNPLFIASYVFNQGASRTLEYSYDLETGFVRGWRATGEWMNEDDFNPAASYAYDTEGAAWQWTWNVFHDLEGLIELMGGRDAFNDKLDEFFSGQPWKTQALASPALLLGRARSSPPNRAG